MLRPPTAPSGAPSAYLAGAVVAAATGNGGNTCKTAGVAQAQHVGPCMWCGASVELGVAYCPTCGHRAGRPPAYCDCGRCEIGV